ncbi:hypothetical protein ACH5RR_034239 [Cinchona calisaya]|uniref:F-box domain-containing protein n=1 Tax=Cinchona calisaya TaxID=153742 RepID=A0ABD2YBN0_9GENT
MGLEGEEEGSGEVTLQQLPLHQKGGLEILAMPLIGGQPVDSSVGTIHPGNFYDNGILVDTGQKSDIQNFHWRKKREEKKTREFTSQPRIPRLPKMEFLMFQDDQHKSGRETEGGLEKDSGKGEFHGFSMVRPSWISKVSRCYNGDNQFKDTLTSLAIQPDLVPYYNYQQGILTNKWWIYVGVMGQLRNKLISCIHESSIGGHSGNMGTYQRLENYFFYPSMKKVVQQWIQNCDVSKRNKSENLATSFFDNVNKLHGLPLSIVTDRDKEGDQEEKADSRTNSIEMDEPRQKRGILIKLNFEYFRLSLRFTWTTAPPLVPPSSSSKAFWGPLSLERSLISCQRVKLRKALSLMGKIASGFGLRKCSKREQLPDDHISQLPHEILVHILSFLTLKEAARTSVLSKLWKNLWTYSVRLDFSDYSASKRIASLKAAQYKSLRERERCKFVEWVNKVLQSHKALALDEFRVHFDLKRSSKEAINQWLQFVSARKVQRLEVDLSGHDNFGCPSPKTYAFRYGPLG